MNVLIVEDSPTQAKLVQEWLLAAMPGVNILLAGTLVEGLGKIDLADVVILDVVLPNSRGTESVQKVCRFGKPVIVITSFVEEELALECLAVGAADFLRKGNFGAVELVRSIRLACELHRLRKT